MEGNGNGVYVVSLEPEPKQEKKNKHTFWHIDKEMVRYKIHFFLLTGSFGAVGPFIPAFVQKELKLSATVFGTVVVFSRIIQSLSKPVIGFIVDYFNKLKTVFSVLTVMIALFVIALFSMGTIPLQISNNITIREDSNVNTFCVPDSSDVCKSFNLSELVTDVKLQKNELLRNLSIQGNVSFKGFDGLCENDTIYMSNNLTDFSSMCHFNKSVPDKDTARRILSWCSTCNSGTNISRSFRISECILCCQNEFVTSSCDTSISRNLSSSTHSAASDLTSHQFWLFACIFTGMYICIGSLYILSETACCETVQKKQGSDYGKQRMFGPIGWGLMSFVGGIISNYTGTYMTACSLMAVMVVILLWNFYKMDFEKPNCSETFFKDVGTTFLSTDFIMFLVFALVNGIGLGAVWYYVVWYLLTLGGNDVLFGLVHTVQNLAGELPFMFVSGWMIRKMGHFNVTTLSLLSYCVRFVYLSYLQNPWYALFLEWTHGIGYGVYYVAIASFAKMNAKPGTEATMQSILFMTFDGFGSAIGNVLTGISIDYFGARQTFSYAGIFFGSFTMISIGFTLFRSYRFSKRTSRTYVTNS